jgi:hypothetical protein
MNAYQLRKAKAIVDLLTCARENSSLTRHQLAKAVSIMSADQWRTVCFTAGVPVADIECKAAVLSILQGKEIHAV